MRVVSRRLPVWKARSPVMVRTGMQKQLNLIQAEVEKEMSPMNLAGEYNYSGGVLSLVDGQPGFV